MEIIQKAKSGMDSQNIQFEDVIRTLEEKRQQMENQLQLAQRERQKAQEDKEKAAAYVEVLYNQASSSRTSPCPTRPGMPSWCAV